MFEMNKHVKTDCNGLDTATYNLIETGSMQEINGLTLNGLARLSTYLSQYVRKEYYNSKSSIMNRIEALKLIDILTSETSTQDEKRRAEAQLRELIQVLIPE